MQIALGVDWNNSGKETLYHSQHLVDVYEMSVPILTTQLMPSLSWTSLSLTVPLHIVYISFLTLCLVFPLSQFFLWWGPHHSHFFMIKIKHHVKLINIAEVKDAALLVPALHWGQLTYDETCQLGYLEEKGFIYQQEFEIQPFYSAATSLSLMALPASTPRCLQKGQEESRLMLRRLTAWSPLVQADLVH